MSLICIQYSELHSIAKSKTFPDLKMLVLGASLGRNKFLTIPQRAWSMKKPLIRGGPMSGSYSTAIELKMISS